MAHVQCNAQARGGRATRTTDEDFYNQGPVEEDEDGVATTSAAVELGTPKVGTPLYSFLSFL